MAQGAPLEAGSSLKEMNANNVYYVYVIQSLRTGKYYTGYTADVRRRIEEHNSGKTKSLRRRGPFRLVYYEAHPTRRDAHRRERQIKRYKGGDAFKALLMPRSNREEVSQSARVIPIFWQGRRIAIREEGLGQFGWLSQLS